MIDDNFITSVIRVIEDTLYDLGVGVTIQTINIACQRTLYELELGQSSRHQVRNPQNRAPIVRRNDILNNLEELSLALSSTVTTETIDGKLYLIIPNDERDFPPLSDLCKYPEVHIGQGDFNRITIEFTESPHLLIAGDMGTGKTTLIRAILHQLAKGGTCKFIIFDPKRIEYIDLHNHSNVIGVVTDKEDAICTLKSILNQIRHRQQALHDNRKRIDDSGYSAIYVIIDDASLFLSDNPTMMAHFEKIALLGRIVDVHLIIATQFPTELNQALIASLPSRICLRMRDKKASRLIIGSDRCGDLLGQGDALFSEGHEVYRLQCAAVHYDSKD